MESLTPQLRTFWRLDSVPVFLDALSSALFSLCLSSESSIRSWALLFYTSLRCWHNFYHQQLRLSKAVMRTIKYPTPSGSSLRCTSERCSICRFIHPHPSLLACQPTGPLLSLKTTWLCEGQDQSVFVGWIPIMCQNYMWETKYKSWAELEKNKQP